MTWLPRPLVVALPVIVLCVGALIRVLGRRVRGSTSTVRAEPVPQTPPRRARAETASHPQHAGSGPTAAREPAPAPEPGRAFRRRAFSGWLPAAVAVAAGLVAAVSVFAYSSGSGLGFGSGSVDSSQPVTITPGTAVDALYPGESADVVATIANPNGFAIHVPSLDLDTAGGTDGGFSVDAGHPGCNLASLGFDGPQTNGGGDFVVPASGTLSVDLTGAVSMDTSATNACQGATFTVYLKVAP